MSVDLPDEQRDLFDLCGNLFNGTINSHDFGRLENLLVTNVDARRLYIHYVYLHRGIADWLGQNTASESTSHLGAVASTGDARAVPRMPILRLATHKLGRLPLSLYSPSLLWWAICSALAIYFVVVLALVPFNQRARLAHKEAATEAATLVGSIVAEEGAKWLPKETELTDSVIEAGRPYELAAGLTEIRLSRGTTLIIEGPAKWTINDENLVTLQSGKLVAKVSTPAVGFAVNTPSAHIVDLGTEFGLHAEETGKTEVQVFKGEVSVQPLGTDKSSAIILRAGDAKRVLVGASGNAIITEVIGERAKLIASLSRDLNESKFSENLVGYWNFDETGLVARDRHRTIRGGFHHGQLQSVARAKGLVGAGGVRFDNEGQKIEVPLKPHEFVFTKGLTIEAAFTASWSGEPDDRDMIYRQVDFGVTTMKLAFENHADSGRVLRFEVRTNDGFKTLDMPLDGREGRPRFSEITNGTPHHVAATFDSALGEMTIFLDGTRRAIRQINARVVIQKPANWSEGDKPFQSAPIDSFHGVIDEVAVYCAAMTAAEISSHWNKVRLGQSYFD